MMPSIRRWSLCWLILTAAACGDNNKVRRDDAGTGSDAMPADAAVPDASVPPGYSAREILSAGGRVTGGSLTVDVQLGHPIEQRATGSGAKTFEGNAAVKP
jgi:hypothetical protein